MANKAQPVADDAPPSKDIAKRVDIACNGCGRILVSISADGTPGDMELQERSCFACEPCDELYAEMQRAERAFEEVQGRRPTYAGRQNALTDLNKARKNLANFLLQLHQAYNSNPLKPAEAHQKEELLGVKRPRSASPSDIAQKPSGHSKIRKKRVSFHHDVAFRDGDEIRTTDGFHRLTEGYVRGKHAAPEGTEYLDTSGHQQDFKEFFRERWIGRKWISLPDSDDETGTEVNNVNPTGANPGNHRKGTRRRSMPAQVLEEEAGEAATEGVAGRSHVERTADSRQEYARTDVSESTGESRSKPSGGAPDDVSVCDEQKEIGPASAETTETNGNAALPSKSGYPQDASTARGRAEDSASQGLQSQGQERGVDGTGMVESNRLVLGLRRSSSWP